MKFASFIFLIRMGELMRQIDCSLILWY